MCGVEQWAIFYFKANQLTKIEQMGLFSESDIHLSILLPTLIKPQG